MGCVIERIAWHRMLIITIEAAWLWYCKSCACTLNRFNADVSFEDGKQMVIYVSPDLSENEAASMTKFTGIVLLFRG